MLFRDLGNFAPHDGGSATLAPGWRSSNGPPLKVSCIGLGTLHFGVYCDQALSTALIRQAFDHGINFIDTAPMYGNGLSETFVGKAIQGMRDRWIISTKVGLVSHPTKDGQFGVERRSLTRTNIRKSVEQSLVSLKTDVIDLLQLHAFDPDTPLEETFLSLKELIQNGKIRSFGCSNYNSEEFQRVISFAGGKSPFVSFQAHFNLIERRAEQELIPLCEQYATGMICNRALARGILSGKYYPQSPPPKGSRGETSFRIQRWLTEPTLKLVQRLSEWAEGYQRSSCELAISWLLSHPQVSTVLLGVRNAEQLGAAVKAIGWEFSPTMNREVDGIIQTHGLTDQTRNLPEVFLET